MAHFRAVIRGGRGEASRLGHKSTGITTRLQTWGWDVVVDALHMASAGPSGEDWAEVELVNHSTGERKLVARLNLTTGELRGGSLSSGPARCFKCDTPTA